MKAAFSVPIEAIKILSDHALLAIFCSLVWLFSMLLIVPGPPATIALYAIAGQLVDHERLIDYGDYWKAVWQYFALGWRWAAINLPILVLLLVDIRTIPRLFPAEAAVPVQLFFYAALAFWMIVNWLALAFLFQQKEPSLRQAFRNAFILVISQAGVVLLLAVITAILLWLSLALVIVNLLFGPMFASLIASEEVRTQLVAFRETQSSS